MKDEKCMRVDRPYIAAAELIGFNTAYLARVGRGVDAHLLGHLHTVRLLDEPRYNKIKISCSVPCSYKVRFTLSTITVHIAYSVRGVQ